MINSDFFTVIDNGVEIERSWSNLSILKKTQVDYIKNNYETPKLSYIFKELYKLENKITENEKHLDNKINKAIEKALNKYKKDCLSRINLIVSVDTMFSIGNEDAPQQLREFDEYIENITQSSIVIVGKNTYNSNWFKQLKLQDVHIRVLTRSYVEVYTENTTVYSDISDIIKRKETEMRDIYILGGEQTFKALYDRVTDMWIAFVDTYNKNATKYFTRLDLYSLDVKECFEITEQNMIYIVSHLKLKKHRQLSWKENVNKYKK